MKAKRIPFIIILGLLVLFLTVAPVVAQATRVEYEGQECHSQPWGPPDRQWVSDDGVIHMRGVPVTNQISSDSPYLAGTNRLEMNVDLNLATGKGHAYGTFTLSPAAIDGTWDGHWSTHISPSGIRGHGVGQGTGDLAGMKLFNWSSNSDPDNPCNKDVGYVLLP